MISQNPSKTLETMCNQAMKAERCASQFSLHIQGLPSNYDWKDLKDLTRQRAKHGIKSDVYDQFDSANRCMRIGVVKVTNRNEAIDLYNWLKSGKAEGRHHVVHLFDATNQHTSLMLSNCTATVCPACTRVELARQAASMLQIADMPAETVMQLNQPSFTSVSPFSPHPMSIWQSPKKPQSFAPSLIVPVQQRGLYTGVPPGFGSAMPSCALQRMPINLQDGSDQVEGRSIVVRGLNFEVRQDEVETLFSKAGQIRSCILQKDAGGAFKGTARIEFATTAQAYLALQTFSDWSWRGRTLRVRMEKTRHIVHDSAQSSYSASQSADVERSIEDQEPVIVNGSGAT